MKTYHNHRQEPYFTFLKNGQKTIEGRLQKGWYQHVQVGDHIHVYNDDETDTVLTEVVGVRPYRNFEELLRKEPMNKVLPDVSDTESGIEVYKKFYSDAQVIECGVVAIEVRLLKR